jgi:3-hydroxyacyl-CoA dehydrogenase
MKEILKRLWKEEILVEDPSEIMSRIHFIKDLKDAVSDSYIIFESVPEKLDIKKEIFRKIGGFNDEAILASNTSVIKISDISEGLESRDRIIGVHWMNPPYILPLVEVAPSKYTKEEVTSKTIEYLENILGKTVVKVPDISGYIVNRFNAAIASEAVKLLDEGISIEEVDKVWKYHLGIIYMLYGPFRNMDYIGLDTVYMAGIYLKNLEES